MSKLAIPMDATGDYQTLGSNSALHTNEHIEKKLIDEDATTYTAALSTRESTVPTYLDELLDEKARLKKPDGQFKHIIRLINAEISRLVQTSDGNNNNNSDRVKRVTLTEKILVPVDKYPKYNFVGRILGPRGMTARQLEEETGCKILVRGRGNQARTEPLHIVIQCEDIEDIAEEKMKYAIERVHVLLNPPPEGKDELKRKQLIELSIINGTYRPTAATKNGLQIPRPQMMPFGGVISPEYLTPLSPEKPSKMSPEKPKVDTYEQYQSMMPMDPFVSGTPESSNMFRQLLDLQPSLSATSYTNPLFAALSSIYSSASIPQGNTGHLLQALSMLNVQPYPKGL